MLYGIVLKRPQNYRLKQADPQPLEERLKLKKLLHVFLHFHYHYISLAAILLEPLQLLQVSHGCVDVETKMLLCQGIHLMLIGRNTRVN